MTTWSALEAPAVVVYGVKKPAVSARRRRYWPRLGMEKTQAPPSATDTESAAWPVDEMLATVTVTRSPARKLPRSPIAFANSPVAVASSVGLAAVTDQMLVPLTSTSTTVLPAPVPAVLAYTLTACTRPLKGAMNAGAKSRFCAAVTAAVLPPTRTSAILLPCARVPGIYPLLLVQGFDGLRSMWTEPTGGQIERRAMGGESLLEVIDVEITKRGESRAASPVWT